MEANPTPARIPSPSPRPIVGHAYDQVSSELERHATGARLGMADDVRQRFQRDAVRGHLDRRRQCRAGLRCVDNDEHAHWLDMLRRVLADRLDKPQFVERGRTQRIGQLANGVHRRAGLHLDVCQEADGGLRITRDQLRCRIGALREAG